MVERGRDPAVLGTCDEDRRAAARARLGLGDATDVVVLATDLDGEVSSFMATCRCDTEVEVEYLRNGGILHMVLRHMAGRRPSRRPVALRV